MQMIFHYLHFMDSKKNNLYIKRKSTHKDRINNDSFGFCYSHSLLAEGFNFAIPHEKVNYANYIVSFE